MIYAFILGKNTALSVAEIISVLKRESFVFVTLSISAKSFIIKTDKEISDPRLFLNRLGGTIKIAEIFSTDDSSYKTKILDHVINNPRDSKFVFGLSTYGLTNNKAGFEIKKELKKNNISSRLVEGKSNQPLSAPEIKNNKIIEKGADFVLIKNKDSLFIGNTIAIQDYESYSYRDYDRPRRNAKSGMLPPKVAQAMINLVPNNPDDPIIIYDPFCGNGTVLQEAALMNYKIIGSDISPERIYDTEKNLEWLEREYSLNIDNPKNILFAKDALTISKKDFSIIPNNIVSEVYLGPPLSGHQERNNILEIVNSLEKKYVDFIKNLHDKLGNIDSIVLAIPFYITRKELFFLNIIDDIKKNGYNVISPLGNTDFSFDFLQEEYSKERETVLYSREDQMVGREIIILKRK